jgi:hypothetical protein
MVLFSASVLVSTVWDVDGNPNTDNLPQMVLPMEAGTSVDAEACIEESGEDALRRRPRFLHWFRVQTVVVREWRWRTLAVPRRGP